jgi:hypothetical protein
MGFKGLKTQAHRTQAAVFELTWNAVLLSTSEHI